MTDLFTKHIMNLSTDSFTRQYQLEQYFANRSRLVDAMSYSLIHSTIKDYPSSLHLTCYGYYIRIDRKKLESPCRECKKLDGYQDMHYYELCQACMSPSNKKLTLKHTFPVVTPSLFRALLLPSFYRQKKGIEDGILDLIESFLIHRPNEPIWKKKQKQKSKIEQRIIQEQEDNDYRVAHGNGNGKGRSKQEKTRLKQLYQSQTIPNKIHSLLPRHQMRRRRMQSKESHH